MPFPGPETALAATIGEAGREYILRGKIRALRGWNRVFTKFQQLTRRLNDLRGNSYFRSMFLAMKNTFAGRSPRRRMK